MAHAAHAAPQRGSCFAQLLDIRNFIVAARRMVMETDAMVVVVLIIIFAIIGLALTPLYITHDLHSTWTWATPLRDAAQPKIDDLGYAVDGVVGNATIMNMTMGQFMGALTLVALTLLPSLFEIAFPSLRHPLLMIVLSACILFDYITDWEASALATASWSGSDNAIVHFAWTALFNFFVSIGIQAILVMCITVVIFGFVRLIGGAAPAVMGDAVIIRK
jgi:hypothetical protein